MEKSHIDQDPSYDPERLSDSSEVNKIPDDIAGLPQELSPHRKVQQLEISIPEYMFPDGLNPYKFDADPPLSLEPAATRINQLLNSHFDRRSILVRAVQSAKHSDTSREQLIRFIVENGLDYLQSPADSFYAASFAPWDHQSSVLFTMEGFHKWKPKSDELPQCPLDIWMIFDSRQFEVAPHLHPLHGVRAEDKYTLQQGYLQSEGLLAVIIVN